MSDEPGETGVDDEALVLGMPSGTSRLPVGEEGEGRVGREGRDRREGEGDILVNGTSRLPVREEGEGREGRDRREGEGDILVNGGEEEKREWR